MNYIINPDLLGEVQAANNPLLNVPDDAKPGRGDTKRWPELLTIVGVSMADTDKGRTEFVVRFRVSLASPNPANRGKNTRLRCLVNTSAPSGTGDHTMTVISLSNITQLLRTVLGELDTTNGLDLSHFFDEMNSPLLSKDVIATVTDKPDRDDPAVRRQELGRFTSVN